MRAQTESGLISFEVDEASLERVQQALGEARDKAPRALKNAVNQTAKQAKGDLAGKAQEEYTVKKTRFTKAMRTKNATTSRPEATITITGKPMELKDFKVSPSSYKPRNRPNVHKAKVLNSSGMKPLEVPSGEKKAFIVKFKSGHITIASRVGSKSLPIKTLLTNSIPVIIGSQERVYGIIQPHIQENLMANLEAEIRKVMPQ